MNYKNINISCFENHYTTKSTSIPLFGFMESMKFEFKTEVEAIRKVTDKKQRDKLKLKLPCVMPSGVFASKQAGGLLKHSRILVIDIDAKENTQITNWSDLRNKLGMLPEVLFSCLSISGNGVFLFVPIANSFKHKEHFTALEKAFSKMGIVIDHAGQNVNRMRCVSFDPEAIINLNAVPYRNVFEPEMPKMSNCATKTKNVEISKLSNWIEKKHGTFSAGNRHEFILGSAACYNRFQISETEAINELMQYACSEFSQKEIIRVIQSVYKKRYSN
jgi:hypothetical protein